MTVLSLPHRVSPLLDDDDAMEAIWQEKYSLAELVAADQFKTYEELEASS